ncbi:UDP-glucose,sterol transferase [Drechmeria coniospora]|uniref:UDP-glucose,sterol transferase n=1 Tax=Drechmeria coniospora TaxID=98403 RepID=A0A151GXC5_DRECN|nr:UDP-glucose,sterol transferase [Drechmeria coniospora]KYK61757.1 UDP-glucose,sterol transferase [Drechmeria coniospora]
MAGVDGNQARPVMILTTPDGQVGHPDLNSPSLNSPPLHSPPLNSPPVDPAEEVSAMEPDESKASQAGSRPRKLSEPFLMKHVGPRRPATLMKWHTAELPAKGVPAASPLGKRLGALDLYDFTAETGRPMDEVDSTSSSEDDDTVLSATSSSIRIDAATRPAMRRSRTSSRTVHEEAHHRFKWLHIGHKQGCCTCRGRVKRDGRLRITVDETTHTGYMAKALGAAAERVRPKRRGTSYFIPPDAAHVPTHLPRLNIVIMVIGSRGDAQPFLKIGKVLKEQYGHRVRIATHPAFRDFVERDSGLEFFSVGGDPSELMAFMVKNPGMIPSLESVRAGEIGRRRAMMADMFEGFWRACIHPTDDVTDCQNRSMLGDKDPFIADAIIANPPSFAHIHCAEALGVPLQLVFTFPYTPTHAFPHPLASIKRSNADAGYTNFISYPLVEVVVWQGLGDLINNFRVKTLRLDPVSTLWAPGAAYRMHVPYTYLWSPALVPKPSDWSDEIDVSGFVFLDLAASFKPPADLEEFLAAGDKPIYIGFGSIVVDDANLFTEMIFEAVEKAGVRALISKGWGGLGADDIPDGVFMLDNIPHDWLFPKVEACVIHGGAGTTAIALKCALPTMVVPFFGDQHFWGSMIGRSGAGPMPVPYKRLDADMLAEGIQYLLTDEAKDAAAKIAESIERDGDGAANAVRSFQTHQHLYGPTTMRCSLLPNRTAVWRLKNCPVRLCPLAVDVLVDAGLITWSKLRLLRHTEWNDFEGPGEPVTGVAGSLTKTLRDVFGGIGVAPYRLGRTAKRRIRNRMRRKSRAKGHESNGDGPEHKLTDETSTDGAEADDGVAVGPGREEYITDVTSSVGRTARAIVRAPADLMLALAQGFHNAPRLYGDPTVRRPTRITGFHSGLVASHREFVYGLYDGVTGVVRFPVRGARSNGAKGLVKGIGMGLTGLVLKSTSAFIGPVGFTLQGVVKQMERRNRPDGFIRRARITQGQRESQGLTDAERTTVEETVTDGWDIMMQLAGEVCNEERLRGISGQIDRVILDTEFMFASVEVAKRYLKDMRGGKGLETIVTEFLERCARRDESTK